MVSRGVKTNDSRLDYLRSTGAKRNRARYFYGPDTKSRATDIESIWEFLAAHVWRGSERHRDDLGVNCLF